jgi:UDP-N-acetylglucosamine acyltransferase
MAAIDPTAHIEAGAVIGPEATIGPFCVVGPNVVIGEGCKLIAHVHITGHTTIGPRGTIYPFASLGTPPQSVKYRGGPTRLLIGAHCEIREGVTMNIGTEDAQGVTRVGDRCFFMAGSHVGHDCDVGNDVTFANNAVIGGHVAVGDHVFFGGHTAMHQFVRIGEGAMIAGMTAARDDIIPFGFVLGQTGELVGLNIVGLRRRGVSRTDMHRLRSAYRMLFFGEGQFAERVEAVSRKFTGDPIVGKIIDFIRDGGSRPLMKARRPREGGDAVDDMGDGQARS